MRRRDLILGAAGAVVAPLAAGGQQTKSMRRIAVSMSTAENEPHEQSAVKAFVDALAQLGTREPLKPPHKSEVLCGPHFQIKRRRLRQIADALFDLERCFQDVKTGNCRRSRTGRQKARQYPHRGRLSGAVRSEKADDLPLLDLEGDVIHRRVTRIPLGKIFHADHRFFFFGSTSFRFSAA